LTPTQVAWVEELAHGMDALLNTLDGGTRLE
jgi:hypothetical protein